MTRNPNPIRAGLRSRAIAAAFLAAAVAGVAAANDDIILADADLVPCEVCEQQARKRVAVMPVNVGELPARVPVSAGSAAERVRDRLEARLSTSPTLIAVNRSHIDAVLGEQKLAASGAAAPVAGATTGRIVPAQLLLYTTVERLDLTTTTERDTTDEAGLYARGALELEEKAAEADARAAELDNRLGWVDIVAESGSPGLAGAMGTYYDAARSIEEGRADARRVEAEALRARGQIEAVKTVDERVRIQVELRVGWRAIDAATSAVVAHGSTTVRETGSREAHSVKSIDGASSTVHDRPDAIVVNDAVDRAIARLAVQIETRLVDEPFRAKVAGVRGDEVVINAGSELGVRPGDLFGVRRAGASIVDPDTGLPIVLDGTPVGAVRVERVQEKAAFGRILRADGEIRPADELQWVGLLVARDDLARVKEEAKRRASARRKRLVELGREQPEPRDPAQALFQKYRVETATDLIDAMIDR